MCKQNCENTILNAARDSMDRRTLRGKETATWLQSSEKIGGKVIVPISSDRQNLTSVQAVYKLRQVTEVV